MTTYVDPHVSGELTYLLANRWAAVQVDDQGREQVTMSTSVKSSVAKSLPPESVGGATGLDADGISMAATGVQEIFVGNAGRMRSMDARKQAECLIWQFPML